ncbi:hypothetical protein PMAYCL1PPCAC_26785, partial [Pristionchus mayeri]
PPFVAPPTEDDQEVAAFGEPLGHDVDDRLASLKLPSRSRSPSPAPTSNGVHSDEKENDCDVPPPLKMETTLKDSSLFSPAPPAVEETSSTPPPVAGIESFLEREAIREGDLPVHSIGLATPVASREPSPCPEKGGNEKCVGLATPVVSREASPCPETSGKEAPPSGLERPESPPRQEPVVDQAPPSESIDNEEDDDFGDFGFAPPPAPPRVDHAVRRDLSTVTEEDSDWAAFQTSSAPVSGKKESVSVDDSDDWAAFESAAPAAERQPSVVDDDDDWATDFASAPPPPAA